MEPTEGAPLHAALPSTMPPAEREMLLRVARESIAHGLCWGGPCTILLLEYPPLLREQRATFVTLHLDNKLRGCIGTLEAHRPLVADVAENAYAAAFRDPRFPALTGAERDRLDVHLSILSPPERLHVTSEADLLAQIRPGIDGLIVQEGPRRGTFLPAVWETLPDPRRFLEHLKQKAGLPVAYWSDTLRVFRYTAESVP